jgi:hypothetical protein
MQDIFLKKTCIKGVRKGWLLSELRTMCDTLKISSKGNKEELCNRISQYFKDKPESNTFLEYIQDNNINQVKLFSLDSDNEIYKITVDNINTAKQECLNYGYVDLYKYLEKLEGTTFNLDLEKILNVLEKGHTEMVVYLYTQFKKTLKVAEINKSIDDLYLLYKDHLPENNYIKYIELSKILKNNAELIKQLELYNIF